TEDPNSGGRIIEVYLNHLNLGYKNYSVFDMSSPGQPQLAALSESMSDDLRKFEIFLPGGGGRLIMIVPSIQVR
ncbi:MAG: hypothetical protein K8F28_01580, partial [Ignavibacteriaceae bacterium]|nr:hypothetical protein [Ignavibacteriaceae bacterium]